MADKTLEPVGKIATLTGPVTIQKADGRIVTLEVGSSLYRGDLILTGVNGKVGLTLADKSRFALGENAKMRVDELSYQPAAKSGNLAVSIMKGVFMFVTGEIAHLRKGEETMKVLTTTATIGIRGTQVAGEVNSDGTDTRFTLLPNPDGSQSTVVISNAAGTQVISENFQSVSISSFFSPPSAPVLVPYEQVAAVYAQAIGVMTQVNATLGLPPPGVTAPADKPVIEQPGIKSLPGGGAQRPTDDANPNSNHAPQVLSKATDPARLTLPTTAPIDPTPPLAIKGTDPARVVDPALAPIDPTPPLAIKATDPARVVDPALTPIDPTPPLAIKATDPARVVDPALAPIDPTQPLAIKAADPARVVDPALAPIAPTQPLAIQPIDPALVVGSSATPTSLTQPLATKGTDPSALAVPSTIATDSALTTATQTSSLGDISNPAIFPNTQKPDIFVLPTHSTGISVTPPVSAPLTPVFVPIVTPIVTPVVVSKPLSGTVADGHISGARIFLDQNDNGAADANEDTGISSDGNGHFAGSTELSVTHALMATGGTNTDTGLANTLLLKAPAGASVINPLTTLVQAFIEAIPGSTVASASSAVKAAFGLGSIDLLLYDPIDAADASSLAVQKIAAEIGSLLTLASANTSLNAQMTANAVMANLVMAINGSGALDLTDASLLATLLAGTGSTVTLALVQAAMSQIAEATDLSQIAEAQLNSLTPGINTPPVATDIAASTEQNTALQGQVVATDIDSSNLAYAQISGPTHGHLTLNTNGSYTYTPTPGYSGTDSFSFSAYDGHTHSNIGTVALTVKALPPTLAINDVTVLENAGVAVFTVSLSSASGQTVTVGYSTSDSTATTGDYTGASGTLTFAPGTTAQTVTVAITDDKTVEPSEAFNVSLNSPTNATLLDALGVGSITDNDNVPTVSSVSSATATEGTALTHTVTLSAATTVASVYAFNLASGTATAGSDFGATPTFGNTGIVYNATSGEITVPVGVSSFTVSYTTVDDALDEPSETTILNIGGQSGQGTILDNDPPPTLAINDVSVLENAGVAVFTVSLSAASGQAVTVGYSTSDSTATAGDYTGASGTLTFAPGTTAQTVTVAITDDKTVEPSEAFNVSLNSPTNATLLDALGVGSITDNDNVPTVSSVSSATATEGTALTHTVTLSAATTVASVYAFILASGTATAGSDFGATPTFGNTGIVYNATSGEITVPVGVSSFTVSYPTVDDTLDEPSETTILNIGGQSGQGTILDNDPPPTLAINDVTVLENAGVAEFTVSLSAASGQAVTVAYNTSDSTATTSDYTGASGTLTFAPGTTAQTVTVAITDDKTVESSETFNVSLSSPTNATLLDSLGVGSITDNDNVPTVTSISSATATEGAALTHTVTLSAATTLASVYTFNLVGDTATPGSDFGATPTFGNTGIVYNATSGEITVPVGVRSFTVSYPTVDDTLDELSETTILSIGGQSGQGTILDNDPTPTLAINDVTVLENAGVAEFTVSLSAASGQTVIVGYSTSDGTATAATAAGDYTSSSGSLTFAPGTTVQSVTVPILNDTTVETSEAFNVNLSKPTNATLVDSLGVGTITDNDNVPTVQSVSSATAAEGTPLTHSVTLSAATSVASVYAFNLAGDTATPGNDFGATPTFNNTGIVYNATSGEITVPSGVSSFTVSYMTVDDTLDEASETTTLTVGGQSGQGTILDNDSPPTLAINDVTVLESANNAVFTVSLSSASGQAVTVAYSTSDGTASAMAAGDYTSSSGSLTFAPGTTVQSVTVPILNDSTVETSETFNVNLSSPSNATLLDSLGVGTITDNDNVPTVTSVSSATASEGTALTHSVILSAATTVASVYAFNLAGSTATAGSDFATTPTFSNASIAYNTTMGEITVPSGVSSFTVSYTTVDDTLDEPSETTILSIGGQTGQGTILDNDSPPTLAINDVTVLESASNAVFTVNLSAASGQAVTVGYNTSDGTATASAAGDYTSTSGTLTFAPGSTTQTVTVAITDDSTVETSETFSVSLSSPTNATLVDSLGVGTITDNDNTPTIRVGQLATGIGDITVVEGADAVFGIMIDYAAIGSTLTLNLADGTATSPADYTAGSFKYSTDGGLSFQNYISAISLLPGSSSLQVKVSTVDDLTVETDETFTLFAELQSGANLYTDTGTAKIQDNDTPALAINDVTLLENAGVAVFTVSLSAASALPVTVGYSTSNGTATTPGDYTGTSGTLTFAPGNTTQTVTIPITSDLFAETTESFNVNLSAPTNATIADGVGVGTILDNGVASLSILNGSNGFRLDGGAANDYSGNAVSSAGDVNGDGFADLMIGAEGADPSSNSSAGSSYVVFGKASGFTPTLALSSLNGSNGFRLDGGAAYDYSAKSVSSAGDVNGDGFTDLIVGAFLADPSGNTSAGSSYVIFGKASGFAPTLALSSMDGNNGFRLDGVAANDRSGLSVSAAGDVNGDGFADLIVGAIQADPGGNSGAGSSYVVFGKASGFAPALTLSSLDGSSGFRIDGVAVDDWSGAAVSSAGDVNGDGFADLIVGAYGADPSGNSSAGSSYVVFGKASGFTPTLALSSLDGNNGFRLNGVAAYDRSGTSVSTAGDVNGDGFTDLIVGAAQADPSGNTSAGSSYVVFGKASGFASALTLSSLDGSNGFRLDGGAADDGSGNSARAAGDVNGDGFADLIVGASGADPSSNSGAGSSYVVFGKASGFAATLALSSLGGSNGFRLDGVTANDSSGTLVSAAGDINGDGFADLMVGAYGADTNGSDSGSTYIIFGGNFTNSVTHVGSANGTTAAERFVGSSGVDTLVGAGGVDAFHAGAGNDVIQLNDNNVTNLAVAGSLADGGSGFDTLLLDGSGITLNFNALVNAGKVSDIEKVDLTGSGSNSLAVSLLNVLNLNSEHVLLVNGDGNDQVTSADQGWTTNAYGSVTVDGTTYPVPNFFGEVAIGGHTYIDYVNGLGHLLVELPVDQNLATTIS